MSLLDRGAQVLAGGQRRLISRVSLAPATGAWHFISPFAGPLWALLGLAVLLVIPGGVIFGPLLASKGLKCDSPCVGEGLFKKKK